MQASLDKHLSYESFNNVENLYNVDTLISGSFNDPIYAENGNDVINGGGGNDTILAAMAKIGLYIAVKSIHDRTLIKLSTKLAITCTQKVLIKSQA